MCKEIVSIRASTLTFYLYASKRSTTKRATTKITQVLLQNGLVSKRKCFETCTSKNCLFLQSSNYLKSLTEIRTRFVRVEVRRSINWAMVADTMCRSGGPFGLRPRPATRFCGSSPSSRLRRLISLTGFACGLFYCLGWEGIRGLKRTRPYRARCAGQTWIS